MSPRRRVANGNRPSVIRRRYDQRTARTLLATRAENATMRRCRPHAGARGQGYEESSGASADYATALYACAALVLHAFEPGKEYPVSLQGLHARCPDSVILAPTNGRGPRFFHIVVAAIAPDTTCSLRGTVRPAPYRCLKDLLSVRRCRTVLRTRTAFLAWTADSNSILYLYKTPRLCSRARACHVLVRPGAGPSSTSRTTSFYNGSRLPRTEVVC